MDLHSRGAAKFPRHRAQIACAQCGNNLFMPEWSELVDDRRVRHLWECDACGYAFETTVHFAEAAKCMIPKSGNRFSDKIMRE
jgi:uncharacterized Zn finger protein